MTQPSLHENFTPTDDVKIGSNRTFGVVFTVVFSIIGLFPLWNSEPVHLWAVGVAGVFLALALIAPKTLAPLNRAWFQFGLLLHKIISPVTMGLIFFGAVMPTGLVMRLLGKRTLVLGFDKEKDTYWNNRTPPSLEPGSMKRQF